jgi:hypothetical protein
MKKKIFPAFFFLNAIIFFSCVSQSNTPFIPVPVAEYYNREYKTIQIGNIIETKGGNSNFNLPDWLAAFFNGGIEEVEKINAYYGKYVFIGSNEGVNFTALNIWADNFSAVKDFPVYAAKRIEKRMIYTALLYPDDEYGIFFETMVKKAHNTVYSGVVKENVYWIKLLNNGENTGIVNNNTEIYNFFVLLTIDRITMQNIINEMMTETIDAVNPAGAHRNAVNRLRQYFFEGF